MLIFLIVVLLLTALFIYVAVSDENFTPMMVLFSLLSIACIVAIPISRLQTSDYIAQYEQCQIAIDDYRNGQPKSNFEGMGLVEFIATENTDIASSKRKNVWYRSGLWIHNSVMDIEPLK
jgi:hypothetical protein